MNQWRTLNLVRKAPIFLVWLLLYPVRIIAVPTIITIGFFATDWEDEPDRRHALKTMKMFTDTLNPLNYPF